MKKHFILATIIAVLTFCVTPAMAVDANGWVDGKNSWNQWQDTNFVEGSLYGNSLQKFEMWGGAGAGIYDPATYTSELIQGQTTEVAHGIPGGTTNYKLNAIQAGFMDLTANPGQEKGISIGGENTTHAALWTGFDPKKCDNGDALMANDGIAELGMSGWVTGVASGDTGTYKSQVYQEIGHERTNEIPGGSMSSFSKSVQLGTIDIGVGVPTE